MYSAVHGRRIAGDCAGARGRCLRQQLWRRQRRRGLELCASRIRSAPNAADVPSTASRMLNCRKYLIGPFHGPRATYSFPPGRRRTGRPAKLDVMHPDEEAPAVGGGRGWVLETGCRRVSRRFDPARRWLAIGKDGVRHAPAAIRQVSRPR